MDDPSIILIIQKKEKEFIIDARKLGVVVFNVVPVSLLYHTDTDQVTIYKTEDDHDHHATEIHRIDRRKQTKISLMFNSFWSSTWICCTFTRLVIM